MSLPKSPKRLCAIAFCAILLVSSATAFGGTGTLDACWNLKSNTIHLVKASAKCPRGETRVTLAAQGSRVAAATTSFGLGRIDGRLQSACSVQHPGDPILDSPQGYTVYVPGSAYLLETDIDGAFHFDLVRPGTYRLVAAKSARAPFDIATIVVTAGKTTVIPTTLVPCAVLCGDGHITGNEQCDDQNTSSGDGCSSTCQIENLCGNGVINAGESCDGADLNGNTCATLGFASGTLSCTTSCLVDSSACVNAQ